MKKRGWFRKLIEWEYWPFHWVYGPVYPVFAWYMARCGFRFFFSASNPSIFSGGFLMESKKKVYDILPAGTYPSTLYFEPGTAAATVLQETLAAGIGFPMILKPDIGGRGRAVVVVNNADELFYYVPQYTLPFLAQDFIAYEKEAGIFFVKQPGSKKGRVTGIVGKTFGSVTGDGEHSIADLIAADERLSLYMDSLAPQLGRRMEEILAPGKTEVLVPFGNHARGAAFFNWKHLIDERLHNWASNLAADIDGFYYGRLDIRFNDWDEMIVENKFSIIELNGAGSEATHIYDPSQSIFYAWKEIIRHWRMLWRVSRANHRKGVPYMSFKEGRRMFRENGQYDEVLDKLHLALLKKFEPVAGKTIQ
jgi:hypothetical protein